LDEEEKQILLVLYAESAFDFRILLSFHHENEKKETQIAWRKCLNLTGDYRRGKLKLRRQQIIL